MYPVFGAFGDVFVFTIMYRIALRWEMYPTNIFVYECLMGNVSAKGIYLRVFGKFAQCLVGLGLALSFTVKRRV